MADATFLDRFTLHLVTQLKNPGAIREFLDAKTSKLDGPSLYWRSKLLVDDFRTAADDNTDTLVFVDLVLDVTTGTSVTLPVQDGLGSAIPTPHLSLCFGLYFLHPENTTTATDEPNTTYLLPRSCRKRGRYVRTKALVKEQLESHAQSIGIDLYSAPPKAMATMMAHSLVGSLSVNSAQDTSSSSKTVTLTLNYTDVQESGDLNLDVAASSTEFDDLGLSLLFLNCQSDNTSSSEVNGKSTTSDLGDNPELYLERSLSRWKKQLEEEHERQKARDQDPSAGVASLEELTGTTNNSQAHPAVASSTGATKKRSRPVGPYVPVGGKKKKKKKGKLTYANQSPECPAKFCNYNPTT